MRAVGAQGPPALEVGGVGGRRQPQKGPGWLLVSLLLPSLFLSKTGRAGSQASASSSGKWPILGPPAPRDGDPNRPSLQRQRHQGGNGAEQEHGVTGVQEWVILHEGWVCSVFVLHGTSKLSQDAPNAVPPPLGEGEEAHGGAGGPALTVPGPPWRPPPPPSTSHS